MAASGHNFSSSYTPTKAQWDAIPALVAHSTEPTTMFMCSNGCGLSTVPGMREWIDLAHKTTVGEAAIGPCPNGQPAPAGTGTAAAAPTSASQLPRHPRVDFLSLMVPSSKHPSFAPAPQALTFDERLMSGVPEQQRISISQQHTLEPVNLRDQERRTIRQVLDTIAGSMAALFAVIDTDDAFKGKEVQIRSYAKAAGATDKVKVGDHVLNMFTLAVTLRGVIERVDHILAVQHKIYKSLSFTNSWVKGMHEALRTDFAAVRDVVERPDRISTPGQFLESTSFAAIGAAMVQRDASAARAFFRLELPREDSIAKKLGWKPPRTSDGGGGGDGADAPAASAAGAAAAQRRDQKNGDKPKNGNKPNKPNPKKRRRGGDRKQGGGGDGDKSKSDG